MRRVVLVVVLGLMLIGSSAFGADGDVIVNGGFKGGTVTAACSAPLSGYMRWNSSSSAYEVCNGTVWTAVGGIIGEVKMYAGAAAPSGWLPCDGSAVSRTTYAALFAVISTIYGVGDGSTTFNLPDLRGRAAIGSGQGAGLTNRALGAKGGEEAHALTAAENGQHSHTDPGHAHRETVIQAGYNIYGEFTGYIVTSANTTVAAGGGSSNSSAVGVAGIRLTEGSGNEGSTNPLNTLAATANLGNSPTSATQAHNTMMPFTVINYIIKY